MAAIFRIGWHPAEILDVDWRLEHIIKVMVTRLENVTKSLELISSSLLVVILLGSLVSQFQSQWRSTTGYYLKSVLFELFCFRS